MKVNPRAEAMILGSRFFRSNKPCHNGHSAPRYTSSGNCVICQKDINKARKQGDRPSLFSYLLHRDDHAAALAFCHALNLQRGLPPKA